MHFDLDKYHHAKCAGCFEFKGLYVGWAMQAFGAHRSVQGGGVFDNPLGIAHLWCKIGFQNRYDHRAAGYGAGSMWVGCIGGCISMCGNHRRTG